MSEIKNRDLVRAYELIEAEKLDEARKILDTYLATNKDNPDAWWLYAYAVTSPQDARRALNNVLRLNPDYPGAKELLDESEQALQQQPVTTTTSAVAAPASGGITRLGGTKPAAEPTPDFLDRLDEDEDELDLDDFDDDEDLDDELDEEPAERRKPNRLILIAGIIGVLVLVILAVVGLMSRNPPGPANVTPTTSIAGVQTPAATNTVIFNIDSTAEATQNIQTGGDFTSVYEALATVEVLQDSAAIETTSVGQTFLISVCSGAGRQQLNTMLETVMPLLAGQADAVAGSADTMGVRLVNCTDQNTILRTIYVSVADAQAFNAGTLSADEFRRRRRAL